MLAPTLVFGGFGTAGGGRAGRAEVAGTVAGRKRKIMKTSRCIIAQVAWLSVLSSWAGAAPVGTAFTYQGRLTDGGNPANGSYLVQFTLCDAASGGAVIAGPITNGPVFITNGQFTATLDFGAEVFDGSARWLQIAVRTNGGAFADLTPRQMLTAAPYATYAPSAGSLSGKANQTFTGAISFNPTAGPPFAVSTSNAVANLNADLLDGWHATAFWQLGGNAGTTPGANFLGTVDNQPLELRVNGSRALRLEYAATPGVFGVAFPNLVGGTGSTISSLGSSVSGGNANQIATGADFAFLGGGEHNTIASNSTYSVLVGGERNGLQAGSHHTFLGSGTRDTIGTNAPYSFLGGGATNSIAANAHHAFLGGGENNGLGAAAFHSFLGGGAENTIQSGAEESFLGGGYQNQIQANAAFAFLGGGKGNVVSAEGGMIPGGNANWVNGIYSFAAGYRAKATLPGSFVWADAHAADFLDSAANSFNVRAAGGIYLAPEVNPDGTPASLITMRGGRGIALPAADSPMLTCGWDPFTSGSKAGLGRWGIFMEPLTLNIGIPAEDVGDRELQLGKYASDGTFTPIISFVNHNVGDWGGIYLAENVTVDHNLFVWGDISNPSDRNLKENIVPVDPLEVLEKVAAMPISEWSYRDRKDSRHIGPMAQDFHAAFDLTADDKSIPLLTANGVALAAIQGLNLKLEEQLAVQAGQLRAKEERIQSLETRLATLERLLAVPLPNR